MSIASKERVALEPQRRPGKLRVAALLDAGAAVIAERGYEAATMAEVITEVAATRITERGQTRADDRTSEAAMEDRKREGYF